MFRNMRRQDRYESSNRFRPSAFEKLERRELFSVGPPTVTGVEVASTMWSDPFTDYLRTAGLGTSGYAVPEGSAAQLASLTWSNLNQIVIKFSEDVHVDSADLSVSGVNVTSYQFSDFHYDPQTFMAVWTLSSVLDKDRLQLDLDTNGLDAVRDLDGNLLDGEWINKVSTVSGNGTAGGDFQFMFHVQPTDVDNTGKITSNDYALIYQLDGKTTTSPGYIAIRDIDGNGQINSTDWQEAINRYSQMRPLGSPAGANNDAPTTSGFDLAQVSDAAIDVAISLLSGFGDLENGSSGLTYSIVSNSAPSLFDTASINPSTKQLVLNTASGAIGRSTLVVRATDTGGLFTDTCITVDVNRQNQPPVISNYYIGSVGAGTWVVSGHVSDPDDDVSNFIVDFYGVFVIRAAVNEFGDFQFAVILEDDDWGWEYAITHDLHGLESNNPFCEIAPT